MVKLMIIGAGVLSLLTLMMVYDHPDPPAQIVNIIVKEKTK